MTKKNDLFSKPIEDKEYRTIEIGCQTWMAENLNINHFRNGDPILNIEDGEAWGNVESGAWCYYNNDPDLGKIYGKLYNWNAVNDPRGLAPEGWHIPSDDDWKELELFLGMNNSDVNSKDWRGTDQGYKLKETGTNHWHVPNTHATNETGFTALPGGYRDVEGFFYVIGNAGYWWTSTEYQSYFAWFRSLFHTSGKIHRITSYEGDGFSVRCVKD